MKQRTWIALILGGTVVLNGVAYGIFRGTRPPPAAEPPRVAASLPAPTPAPPVLPPPAATPPQVAEAPSPAPAPETPAVPQDEENSGLARAHRASGLAALEDRDYDTAVADFTEALRLRKDKGDLPELLRIAEELRLRGQTRTARAESAWPSRESAAPSRSPLKSRTGRLASRSALREEPAPEPEGTRSGLLLVTSTPPGLVVMVDGKARDLTPARLSLAVGSYRVALAHGERRLVEEMVEVKEDAVQSLNRDVTADLPATPPPPVAASRPPPEPVAAAPVVAAPPVTAAPSASETPAPSGVAASAAVAQAAPAVARVPALGDLDVASPALYGEVWINNRPYGFPPVSARGLPAGPARVEVRVNGEVKRRMTVQVEPGRSTAVRVR